MKVVLVELPHETGEVGVLEHARENGLCELVHVLSRRESGARGQQRWNAL